MDHDDRDAGSASTSIIDRDEQIAAALLIGRSVRSVCKEFAVSREQVDSVIEERWSVSNEARLRHVRLDCAKLDKLCEVFLRRALLERDCPSALVVTKVLERKAALLALDAPVRVDVLQIAAQQMPTQFERIRAAIFSVARNGQGESGPDAGDMLSAPDGDEQSH